SLKRNIMYFIVILKSIGIDGEVAEGEGVHDPSAARGGPSDNRRSRDCTVNVQLTSPAQDGGARIRVSFSFILHTYIYIYTVYRHTPL
uniref:Uncharacterized protein n=1 Tax=Mola mola TaxID=94237 RepID=A0A3Q4BQW1_MOLML